MAKKSSVAGEEKKSMSLLLVDDEADILKKMSLFLNDQGYRVDTVNSADKALEKLDESPIDIVLTDVRMPGMTGLELLEKIKENHPGVEVIILTGFGDMDTAVKALRHGALDFLTKPVKLSLIEAALFRSQSYLKTLRENKKLRAQVKESSAVLEKTLDSLKGESPQIEKVKELITKAGEYDTTTVLITGESGTGKELVARAIHYGSVRKDKPFVTVNCSAIPHNLIESEFFGYRKGSFTGASENKTGFFEAADEGSIFLDEIGDMPLDAQMKLLRVLEDKKIKPVGHRHDIEVDVRTIAATNQKLEQQVVDGEFRQDLFYRLDVFRIELPPLRERAEDIPLLVDHFVEEFAPILRKEIDKVENKVYKGLGKYSFPGNVRELRNMVERAMILASGKKLEWKNFQDRINLALSGDGENLAGPQTLNVKEHENYLIQKALQQTDYNRHQAAKLLGMSWSTLDRKMKQLGL